MNGTLITQNIPRGLLVVVMTIVSVNAPYINSVEITKIQRHAGVWIIEGTITIDPMKVPAELGYNYDSEGFLNWWEEHINDVLSMSGKKNIQVRSLELTWIQIGETDIIGFHAELVFGSERAHNK